MSESRQLEEAAATLDDVALTLDEVREEASGYVGGNDKLEQAKRSIADAVDVIEEAAAQLRFGLARLSRIRT
jgi:hypothetical protein